MALPLATISSSEIIAKTGISKRKLQWWDQTGLVPATFEGSRRFYTETQLFEIRLVMMLRARGIRIRFVKNVLKHLRRGMDVARYLIIEDETGRVFQASTATEITDIFSKSEKGLFFFDLTKMLCTWPRAGR